MPNFLDVLPPFWYPHLNVSPLFFYKVSCITQWFSLFFGQIYIFGHFSPLSFLILWFFSCFSTDLNFYFLFHFILTCCCCLYLCVIKCIFLAIKCEIINYQMRRLSHLIDWSWHRRKNHKCTPSNGTAASERLLCPVPPPLRSLNLGVPSCPVVLSPPTNHISVEAYGFIIKIHVRIFIEICNRGKKEVDGCPE